MIAVTRFNHPFILSQQKTLDRKLTVPLCVTVRPAASASQPTISEMSWTSCFVSRLVVLCDLSCDSLALRHG